VTVTTDTDLTQAEPRALDPSALTLADAARLLGVSEATLRAHAEAGAPFGPDGHLNLVHYAAWLNQRLTRGD